MKNKFARKLIEVEIKLGFLSIPSHGIKFMPNKKTTIIVILDGKKRSLSYNPKHRRIFGLTKWYRKHNAKPKDEVTLVKHSENKYELYFKSRDIVTEKQKEEEAEELIDLSGLSSKAKGDIVEDRIKELLLLHGQGLLNIYKPVIDIEGVDLIVVKSGQFHPIFLQIKGRYNLHKDRSLILSVRVKTFNPHLNYYVIGVFFDPKTLEINENILLIPSKDLVKNAITVKSKKRGEWYRIVSGLTENYAGKWAKYLINKNELATRLIEKFEEINKYYK